MKKYKLQRIDLHPISDAVKKTGVYFEFPDRKMLSTVPDSKVIMTAELISVTYKESCKKPGIKVPKFQFTFDNSVAIIEDKDIQAYKG